MDASVPAAKPGLAARISALGGGSSVVPLLILFGLNAVDELDRAAFGTVLPEIREHFGLSLTGVTTLAAAVIPAALLVGVPIGRLADRSRRVPIALAGASAWGVFSVFTGLAPTIVLLGFARVGAGLGRAVNDPVHSSLLSDFYPPTARAKVFSFHRAANPVGAFCGPLIGGFLARSFGWRVPFIVLAVPTIVLVVIAATSLREPDRTGLRVATGRVRFREAFRLLWAVRTLRRVWMAFPFVAFVAVALGELFSLYYSEVFDVPVDVRGVIRAFDAPFIVLGLVLFSPFIDRGIARHPDRVLKAIGFVAGGVISSFILGAALAPRLWVGIVFDYGINTVALVLYAGGFALVSLVAPPDARASAFAFFNISSLLGVLALPMVGIVGDAFGLRAGMAVLTPILVIGGIIIASASRFVREDIERVNPGHQGPEHTLDTL